MLLPEDYLWKFWWTHILLFIFQASWQYSGFVALYFLNLARIQKELRTKGSIGKMLQKSLSEQHKILPLPWDDCFSNKLMWGGFIIKVHGFLNSLAATNTKAYFPRKKIIAYILRRRFIRSMKDSWGLLGMLKVQTQGLVSYDIVNLLF